MGPSDVVANYLQADTADGTANPWVAAYPSYFSSNAQVPQWQYLSLKTLLGASSVADYQRRVVTRAGLTGAVAEAGIELYSACYEASEQKPGDSNDQPGAETTTLKVLIRQDRNNPNPTMVEQVSERIRWLIDFNIRYERGSPASALRTLPAGEGADLPIPNGLGVNSDFYFRCYWRGIAEPENAIQWTNVYRVQYVRILL